MVIQTFYPLIGGSEKQCLAISKALIKRGLNVKVFTERWVPFPAYEVIEGVPIKRFGRGGPRFFHSLFFMASVCFYLLARAKTYDVIHVHLAASHAVAAAFIGRLLGKKMIVKIGGGTLVGEIATSRRTLRGKVKLLALGLLKPQFVILNQDQRHDLQGYGLSKVPVVHIPNGVDTNTYFPVSAQEKDALRTKLGWKGFVFLFAGRFSPDKITMAIFENLLTGWTAAVKQEHDIHFYLMGRGPLEADYRRTIERRNLQKSIHILSAKTKIHEFYQAADAFLLPSSSEGFSNALLEAMACGLPVLASKVPGITDLIREDMHGYLFDPTSAPDFGAAVHKLLGRRKNLHELQKNVRSTAADYSIANAVDRYIALYEGKEI